MRDKYVSDTIDSACQELVGHNNWGFVDEVISSDAIQCGVGDNVAHLIAIFKEPLEEEEDG